MLVNKEGTMSPQFLGMAFGLLISQLAYESKIPGRARDIGFYVGPIIFFVSYILAA